MDERLTTRAAAGTLRAEGRSARDQRGLIDQNAAALLLQTWVEQRRSERTRAERMGARGGELGEQKTGHPARRLYRPGAVVRVRGAPRSRPPSHRAGRARRHPVLLTLLIVLILLRRPGDRRLRLGGGSDQSRRTSRARRGGPYPWGLSTAKIGGILAKAGVIHDATLFTLYVRIKGDGPLLPGSYSLPRNSSYNSAISALEAGPKLVTDTLRIPEGYTIRQIAAAVAALPDLHLSASRFLAAATSGEVTQPLRARRRQQPRRAALPRHLPGAAGGDRGGRAGGAGRRVQRPGQPGRPDARPQPACI